MQSLSHIARVVTVTHLSMDVLESDLITKFPSTGCGCVRKCSGQFTIEHITSMRASCTELSHSELDTMILGQLMAFVNTSSKVQQQLVTRKMNARRLTLLYPIKESRFVFGRSSFYVVWGASG